MSVNENKTIITEEREVCRAGMNISWGAIFAGLLSFLSLELLFSFVSSAIGFGVADLNHAESAGQAGTGLLIWTVVSLVVSFFISGMIVGSSSGRNAAIHGFLSWSLSIIVVFALLFSAVSSVFSGLGQLLGQVGHGLGNVVQEASTAVSNGTGESFESLTKDFSVNAAGWDEKTLKVMKDSGVAELQPDYLKSQVNDVVEEAKAAAKTVATNPDSFKEEADKLFKSIQDKVKNIADSVDKDTVSKAVAKNSDLSEEEAKKMTENIIVGYKKGAEEVKAQLKAAESKFEELKAQVLETAEKAKDTANDAMNTTSQASVYAFVALLVSALITILGAVLGKKAVVKRVHHIV